MILIWVGTYCASGMPQIVHRKCTVVQMFPYKLVKQCPPPKSSTVYNFWKAAETPELDLRIILHTKKSNVNLN